MREALCFTQQDVARKANLSYTAVERIERGLLVFTPTVWEVASVLGISLDELCNPDDLSRRENGRSAVTVANEESNGQ